MISFFFYNSVLFYCNGVFFLVFHQKNQHSATTILAPAMMAVGPYPMFSVCLLVQRNVAQVVVMNKAGISVMMYGLFVRARYTVSIHRVKTESVWLDQPNQFHIMLNPLGLPICHISSAMVQANMGTQI